MRRSLIILALVFLLAGCPDDDSSNGSTGSSSLGTTNGNETGSLYVDDRGCGPQQSAVVPEPTTLALFSLGAAGFAALQLRRRKNG